LNFSCIFTYVWCKCPIFLNFIKFFMNEAFFNLGENQHLDFGLWMFVRMSYQSNMKWMKFIQVLYKRNFCLLINSVTSLFIWCLVIFAHNSKVVHVEMGLNIFFAKLKILYVRSYQVKISIALETPFCFHIYIPLLRWLT